MGDPFYLADILLGRVGVLRSTAESIVLELCEAREKLDSQAARQNSAGDGDGGTASTSSSEDALRVAIQSRLKRVQTNLELLRRLGPEFGGSTSPSRLGTQRNPLIFFPLDAKTKPIENVTQAHRYAVGHIWPNQSRTATSLTIALS
jgi:hypothetical protein